jgi:N-carbamoyl-L-amino-acid hydrolase
MPSGAGHDAQMMQRFCPTAMIFVPSAAGLSHNVKEHTEAADLVAGAQMLMNLVLELAA